MNDDHGLLRLHLARFLEEDLGRGDPTSTAVVPAGRLARGEVRAGAAGVVAGLEECLLLAEMSGVSASARMRDGDALAVGDLVLGVEGQARAILGVERTLLNLLSHLSGVATLTRKAVDAVASAHRGATSTNPPRIAATRKTLPGLRLLQKRAVVTGGGLPHRFDLGDAVLIKDNHLLVEPDIAVAIARARAAAIARARTAAVDGARPGAGGAAVEIEVETVDQALAAARAGADALLLDNMSPAQLRDVVEGLRSAGLRDGRVLEASGGITPDNVCEYADTGVDIISMGALTAAPSPIDFSLHLVP